MFRSRDDLVLQFHAWFKLEPKAGLLVDSFLSNAFFVRKRMLIPGYFFSHLCTTQNFYFVFYFRFHVPFRFHHHIFIVPCTDGEPGLKVSQNSTLRSFQ